MRSFWTNFAGPAAGDSKAPTTADSDAVNEAVQMEDFEQPEDVQDSAKGVAKQPTGVRQPTGVKQPPGGVKQPGTQRSLRAGVWRSDRTPPLRVQGGQVMRFVVRNTGLLPTQVSIAAHTGETIARYIAPGSSAEFRFSMFGSEPMSWTFTATISADGAVLPWELFSTWVPGDPPNR
ncbi:MAG: hypothetical protein L0Y71_13125 [Gemmataceae bacterium]|nr:hypothetical protein [Gemmataceae bacterium]